jgi:hypothetical protein
MPSNEEHNIAGLQRFIDPAVNGHDPSIIDERLEQHAPRNPRGHRDRRQGRAAVHKQRHQRRPVHGPPAHRQHAEWLGIGIYTVSHGRITQGWFAEDILSMLTQLNVLPVPE